jgi:hypothetical protein
MNGIKKLLNPLSKKFSILYDTLAEYPELGTIQNKEMEIRGFTMVKQINIFYKISKHQLIILDFFDNRQSPQKKRF